jgi:hypothetical protein
MLFLLSKLLFILFDVVVAVDVVVIMVVDVVNLNSIDVNVAVVFVDNHTLNLLFCMVLGMFMNYDIVVAVCGGGVDVDTVNIVC